MPGCVKAQSERHNALRKHFPEGIAGLSAASKKQAVLYATTWMKVFSVLGTSGLANQTHFERAFNDELLPIIQPLQNGSDAEKRAFAAAMKIHEALAYLSERKRSKGSRFDNPELNTLLRIDAGDESNLRTISEGVSELLFDFAQLVDPVGYAEADWAFKHLSR